MKNENARLGNIDQTAVAPEAARRLRFDRLEWAGAFADLGTFIPFIAAYISVLKMDPVGIFFAFGISLVACGFFYRTPFPVQPMKAIGAVAATQAGAITGTSVVAAGIITGAIWLILGLTGMASRIARVVPKEIVLGIMLGLGMSFMFEGVKMMSSNWSVAGAAVLVAILLRNSRSLPAMFVLLLGGFAYSLVIDPALPAQLGRVAVEFRLPTLLAPTLSANDFLIGALYLALPQVPLTLGNAIIGMKEENNRLFPDRPVTARRVAISTGVMNLFGSAIGSVPMCHGAGGMAAHASFGARSGGASIIIGVLLITLALGFGGSIEFLLRAFPAAVLGAILFFAGVLLAAGNMPARATKTQAFIVALTAATAIWNVAGAFAAGIVLHQLAKRRERT